MKPHKHAEVIKAWADNKPIQRRMSDGFWMDVTTLAPYFNAESEFRIKPEPPEMAYPKTRMTNEVLNDVYDRSHNRLQKIFFPEGELAAVANAAMTRAKPPAPDLLTDWIPCTTPPVRDGVYEITGTSYIGLMKPFRMAYTNGEWLRMDGNVFLGGAEITKWSWRGVRRWVLVRKAHPIFDPARGYLVEARPRSALFGELGVLTRPFLTEAAAKRFANRYSRLGLTAVLP